MTRYATRTFGRRAAAILPILAAAWILLSAAPAVAQSSKATPTPKSAAAPDVTAVAASHAGATRVAFVDIERISTEAKFVKEMLGDIEKEIEAKRAAIAKKQETYDKLRDDLTRKRDVLTQSEYDSDLKESRRLFSELQDDDEELNKTMDKYHKEVLAPALDKIIKAVQEVAKRDGFDIVLRGELVVHGDPSVDLTDRVIEYVNADYKPTAKDSSAKESSSSKDSNSGAKSTSKDTKATSSKDSKDSKRAPAVSSE